MTREQKMAGRRLLKRLLPEAIEKAKSDSMEAEQRSEIAIRMAQVLTLDNLDALVIHEGALGGWHIDLVFKNMPTGYPTVMGSPVAMPYRTLQEALDTAPDLLACFVKIALSKKDKVSDPVFEFHGASFTISPRALEVLIGQGLLASGYDADKAIDRLHQLETTLLPGGFSDASWKKLTKDEKMLFIANFHMASATGLFRYPVREAASPSAHTGTATRH